MLYYTEVHLSPLEVPDENSICIYIAGCLNRCAHCHYPELQQTDYSDLLCRYYAEILAAYACMATCVCFLGGGSNTCEEHQEFQQFCDIAGQYGLRSCLYSGRDVAIESWMHCFDYIKLGSFQERLGPLSSPLTNQKLYQRKSSGYQDITHLFWE